ncbi:Mu transposase C-terminal domain-containing protein [Desulfacinum hydrothermale]|uniref:Mu transposase C-terminal domain-containing protein n=1 Tax=Desulfacinum hydrothermale TaxID=109258 RepID=UPI0014826E22|nr:Mu transposase C-terminal domain-containing protein [Desulfacinum hydrothermale]
MFRWEMERRIEAIRENPPPGPPTDKIPPSVPQMPLSMMSPALDQTVRECMVRAEALREERRRRYQPLPLGMPERAKSLGLARYRLVHAFRDAVENVPWGERAKARKSFLTAYHSGRLLPEVYERLGKVSLKTLYRWDKRLREADDDFLAIADTRGGWMRHGTTRWRERQLSEPARRALLRCYLQPNRPSVATAIRAARMVLRAQGIDEPASDHTYRRWLDDYCTTHQHIVVLMREGEKAYKDRVAPHADRADWLLDVGACLVADGHPLDFFIRHPETGKPARMQLIVFFDWASRYPAGWQIMPTENTVAIHAALRRAILTLGKLPTSVYIDNGRAFKARVFTEQDPDLGELSGIYARMGIAVFTARPYEARSKVVERFFQTLSDQFEAVLPSYCGSSIERKPAWMQRNERLHKAWHEAKFRGWIPDIREAAHLIERYIDWYVDQPHRGLSGKTPREVFEAGKGPGVDEMELGWEMLWRAERPVRRCRIRMYGIDYEGDCLHGINGRVAVYYDCADLSRVWVCTRDGRLLGECYPVEALHPLARLFGDEVAVDQVRAALERQRRLRKQTIEQLQELGVAPDDIRDVVDAPWGMAPVLAGSKRGDSAPALPEPEPDADQEEMDRLRLVYERLGEEEDPKDESQGPERPEWFGSEPERYEWCWRAKHVHRAPLSAEDEAFMAYYRTTSEYRENYADRYEQLAELYGVLDGGAEE